MARILPRLRWNCEGGTLDASHVSLKRRSPPDAEDCVEVRLLEGLVILVEEVGVVSAMNGGVKQGVCVG